MNRFLNALGNLFLAGVVVAIVAAAYLIVRTQNLNEDASRYVDRAVRAMVDPWSHQEMIKRAAPEMLRRGGEKFFPELFTWYSTLGKLKALGKPAGRVGTGAFPGTPIRGTWADFVVPAQFEAGPAEIKLTLKRTGEDWQIMNLQINSPAFAQKRKAPQG